MNETNPNHPDSHDDALAPLDAFEQQWVDHLAQREPDLVQTEDAFVQSVMQAEAVPAAGSPVIARIGKAALPFAIAAALLLAAFVGYTVLTDDANDTPGEPSIVNQLPEPTQPNNEPAVATNDRPKVELGKLIAQATTANPANDLNSTVSEVNETLSVDRLFDVLGDSVPDLKELLAPLESKNEQSRA